jgi:hypothetical protein
MMRTSEKPDARQKLEEHQHTPSTETEDLDYEYDRENEGPHGRKPGECL